MNSILSFILQPWPWWVAGPVIFVVMAGLIFSGKTFGVSSNLRTFCAMGGAHKFPGKAGDFFRYDWRFQSWNLVFVFGALAAGIILHFLQTPAAHIAISESTVQSLSAYGISANDGFAPNALFGLDMLFSIKGFLVLAAGGLLIGFGSRWAGGCTSGHAISGLSNLQLPSLISVIGFFAGGLVMTWFILPLLFSALFGGGQNG